MSPILYNVLVFTVLIINHSKTDGLPDVCGDGLKCVSKCCPENQYLNMGKCTTPKEVNNTINFMDFSNVTVYNEILKSTQLSLDKVFTIVQSSSIHDEEITLNDKQVLFYLLENGKLHIGFDIDNTEYQPTVLESDSFCFDYMKRDEGITIGVTFHTISDTSNEALKKTLNLAAHIISIIFLSAVLIVYSVFDSLRNIYGKVVMSVAVSWLGSSVMFITLSLLMIYYTNLKETVCIGLNFSFYFFFLASFFWMNIFSFDIWKQFRSKRLKSFREVRGDYRRKYIIYSIYAWGTPCTMTIFATCIDLNYIEVPTTFLKPNIMLNQCFFGYKEKRYYMYIPILILICSNLIFFSVTVYSIWQTKKRSNQMKVNGTPNNIKIRLLIFIRLSLVMGIGWLIEVIASFTPESPIWLVTELYNVLIGVGIFVITVMNKKVYKLINERFRKGRQYFRKAEKPPSESRTLESTISEDLSNAMTSESKIFNDPSNAMTQESKISNDPSNAMDLKLINENKISKFPDSNMLRQSRM